MHREILSKIEKENEVENYWIIGPETGRLLWWLVRTWAPENALEIGTSVGYSAIWIGDALKKNGKGGLWTVESHAKRFEKAKKNLLEAGMDGRVVQLKGHAPEIFYEDYEDVELPEEFDFVFLDATKCEHGAYFDAVFPRLRSGALLVVDNVQSHRDEMADFLDRIAAHKKLEEVELSIGKGLLLARKI